MGKKDEIHAHLRSQGFGVFRGILPRMANQLGSAAMKEWAGKNQDLRSFLPLLVV